MQFYIAFRLGYNHAQREMIVRRIESFQIFKILADLFADQNVPQEYSDHQKFLCDWLISTACRRQNIELVELAIEMGSSYACAVYALMVMQRRLPRQKQMEAFSLLEEGNTKCCAHCKGALAAFCAFNNAIDDKVRFKFAGSMFNFWSACQSASRGSSIGIGVVAGLLRYFATKSEDDGRPMHISPDNEFLSVRFPELTQEILDFFLRSDREPYIDRSTMITMAEELENDLQKHPLRALLRF